MGPHGTHETSAISLCIDSELAGGTLIVLLASALITDSLITDYFRATSHSPISPHRLATSIVQPNRRLVPHLFSYLPDPFSFLDVPWHIHNHDAIHAFH
jgi:hypothetical protein